MEKENEKHLTPETESSRLKLDWFDLRAGHWPDLKAPPWGLNISGTVRKRWPEISKILIKAQEELKPHEERVFWSGEVEFPDGRIEVVDIKISSRKLASGQNSIDLWIWPKDSKYYEKK